jgi:hypothetical protein
MRNLNPIPDSRSAPGDGMGDGRALPAARARRDELYDAILDLERVLSAPAVANPAVWSTRVRVALDALGAALDNHVAVTEGAGGLFEEIMDREPRLAHAIERVRAGHAPLQRSVADARTRLEAVDDPAAVAEVRDALLELLRALFTHRHHGAELVYEAYNVDVSSGD